MAKRDELLAVINDNSADSIIKDEARKELAKLDQIEAMDTNALSDDEIGDAISKLNDAIESATTNLEVEDDKIRDIVAEQFKSTKLGIKNLSKSVVELIGRSQTVTLVNFTNKSKAKADSKLRKLAEVILSDYEAGNNVYLYGGAGTGKTYISNQIADYLNYKLVTLNCNQFTGGLDIIGGQTIEGYQEGRMTTAFGNIDLGTYIDDKGNQVAYKGALLLLDELPKLDPNSAGILNDGLSKIKDPYKYKGTTASGEQIIVPPSIMNGRGELIEKKNIFVIATGNSKLNEADKDYEANFKQDLSLQDRFAGSTYRVTIDPDFELEQIMKGIAVSVGSEDLICNFTFIFNFLFKLRSAIDEQERYNSRAFVSTRLMVSMRDTYIAYRVNLSQQNPIPNPKTLQMGIESFLSLFTDEQRGFLETNVDVKQFYLLVKSKDMMPINELDSDIDTQESKDLIEKYKLSNPDQL
jgi:Mor family transcriptional regulator